MAQVNVIGRITADLELKTSEKSNPYVRFAVPSHSDIYMDQQEWSFLL